MTSLYDLSRSFKGLFALPKKRNILDGLKKINENNVLMVKPLLFRRTVLKRTNGNPNHEIDRNRKVALTYTKKA